MLVVVMSMPLLFSLPVFMVLSIVLLVSTSIASISISVPAMPPYLETSHKIFSHSAGYIACEKEQELYFETERINVYAMDDVYVHIVYASRDMQIYVLYQVLLPQDERAHPRA